MLTAFFMCGNVLFASPVVLEIKYFVGDKPFVPSEYFTSNDGLQQIQLSRLEFYLSSVRVVANNGQEELLRESFVLANALGNTPTYVGSTELSNISSVKFGIGVPPIYNHLDPSTYPTGHPLGHQNPSMHWGWTAGYRFVAVEGLARENDAATPNHFEIHTVDDSLYRNAHTPAKTRMNGDTIVLTVKADIGRLLETIRVYTGIINHSAEGEAITVMDNMAQKVFSPIPTSVAESKRISSIALWPNPVLNTCNVRSTTTGQLQMIDITGSDVLTTTLQPGENTVNVSMLHTGMYLVVITTPDGRTAVEHLVRY